MGSFFFFFFFFFFLYSADLYEYFALWCTCVKCVVEFKIQKLKRCGAGVAVLFTTGWWLKVWKGCRPGCGRFPGSGLPQLQLVADSIT